MSGHSIAVLGEMDRKNLNAQLAEAGIRARVSLCPNHWEGLRNIKFSRRNQEIDIILIILRPQSQGGLRNPKQFVREVLGAFDPECQIVVAAGVHGILFPFADLGCLTCHTELIGTTLAEALETATAAA